MRLIATLLLAVLATQTRAQFLPDGPDAPEVTISWDNGYLFTLSNPPGSNNEGEAYAELITDASPSAVDPYWRFQGYLIFQVVNGFNPYTDNYFDPALSRLAGSSDIADGIGDVDGVRLYQEFDQFQNVVFDSCYQETVLADDAGTTLAYSVVTDGFTGLPFDPVATVCFVSVAYATNMEYTDPSCNAADHILIGRKASTGAIQVHCFTASTIGINERQALSSISSTQLGDHLLVRGTTSGGTLALFDAQGRVVIRQRTSGEQELMSIVGLPSGSYVVRCITAERGVASVRASIINEP